MKSIKVGLQVKLEQQQQMVQGTQSSLRSLLQRAATWRIKWRDPDAHQWKLGVRWQMIFAVYDESCYYSNAVHTCTCQVSSHVPGGEMD